MSDTTTFFSEEKRLLDRYSFEIIRDKIAVYAGVYLDHSQQRVVELALQ